MTTLQHDHMEERKAISRRERSTVGRTLWGLLLAGIGGYWLTTNLTNNAELVAENPGRVVLPALIIAQGVAAILVKRDHR